MHGSSCVASVMPLINEIKASSSFTIYQQVGYLWASWQPNLMPFSVSPDFKNAQMNVLWEKHALILPDTTYYEEGNEKGPELLAIYVKWWKVWQNLISEEEIKDILDKVAVDAELAKYVLPNEEKSEYNKLYHPYEWADFKALGPRIATDAFFTEVIGQTPDKIIVPEERYLKEFAPTFYSASNWDPSCCIETWRSSFLDSILTKEIRVLAGEYSRTIAGIPEPQKKSSLYQ